MLGLLLTLPLLVTGIQPTDCLVLIHADIRAVEGEAWLEAVDVLDIGADYLIAEVEGTRLDVLPPHTILDRGDLDSARYLKVELLSPAGRSTAEHLGRILFARDLVLIVRQEGDVPADFQLAGIRGVVELRSIVIGATSDGLGPFPSPAHPDLVADIVAGVSDASYQGVIQDLEDFTTRNARHVNFMNACLYAHDVFESYGIPAEIEEYVADPWSGADFTCWNVVAEKPGAVYPDSVFIICGHLDSTAGSPSTPEAVAPGADDNASGSATVLEAARVMSTYDFKYTVRFICFGAEEQGLCGSRVYAAAAAANGDLILGVVNLDMLLFGPIGHDTIKVVYNSNSYPVAQAFGTAAASYVPDLNVSLVYSPGSSGSDHYSFWQVGYRAIEGIEIYLSGNPHYHRTSDLLINYQPYFPFGTNGARAGIATLASLADPLPTADILELAAAPALETLTITSLCPNPARDQTQVTLRSGAEAPVRLTLFDVAGRAVSRRELTVGAGSVGIELGLAGLPSGIYLLRAEGERTGATRKVVVSR